MRSPAPRRLGRWLGLLILLLGAGLLPASAARGQERLDSIAVTLGSGLSLATGQRSALMDRTPLFLDLAYRSWSSEDPTVVIGVSARLEVEGRTSVGAVPRLELNTMLGPLTLRPGIGAPLFVAPFTLIGIEGSLTARLALTETLGVAVFLAADAFVFGSDLPDNSVLLMFNSAAGIDLAL